MKLKQILQIIYLLGSIVVVCLAALFMFSVLPIKGNYQVLAVLSGSMEPAIKVGSVVIVKPEASYKTNDIITFKLPGTNQLVTHRVWLIQYDENLRKHYLTKGDANDEADRWTVFSEQVQGKMVFAIPFLGYISLWLQSPIGFMAAIVIPAAMIIYHELIAIKDWLINLVAKKKLGKASGRVLGVVVLMLSIGFLGIRASNAIFTDREASQGNLVQAWGQNENGNADLKVQPAAQSVSLDQTGTFNIDIIPNGAQVNGVELVINYNAQVLRINNISAGNFFTDPQVGNPIELIKSISVPGVIHYAVGFPLGSGYFSTANGSMAIVSFTAVGLGNSSINLVIDGTQKTIVSDINANNVLNTAQPGSINVN